MYIGYTPKAIQGESISYLYIPLIALKVNNQFANISLGLYIYSVLGKCGHISYIRVPNKGLDLLKDRGILVSSLSTKVRSINGLPKLGLEKAHRLVWAYCTISKCREL